MTKVILEQAVPAEWVDQVFEKHRQRQYPRELLFSTIVELMSLVSLGLRPSLHAAARQMEDLPV
ncbi:IS4 family transposase, partial [Pseudomonas proteolytica]|nr:IS4 family transposase [Pseudomonas proteolytica]